MRNLIFDSKTAWPVSSYSSGSVKETIMIIVIVAIGVIVIIIIIMLCNYAQ